MEVVQGMKQMQSTKPHAKRHTKSGDTGDTGDTDQPPYARETQVYKNDLGVGAEVCHQCHQCHQPGRDAGPPPLRRYATGDTPDRRVFSVNDDPLPLSDDTHLASCDVMILTCAARRHAEHLAQLGTVSPDAWQLIRNNLDAIVRLLDPQPDEPPPPPTPPKGRPRPPAALRLASETNSLFDATRANTGDPHGLPPPA